MVATWGRWYITGVEEQQVILYHIRIIVIFLWLYIIYVFTQRMEKN